MAVWSILKIGGIGMKAIRGHYRESIIIGEVPDPKPVQNEVMIAPSYGSICGSDIAICQFHGKKYPGIEPTRERPVVLGHEWSGQLHGRTVSAGCTLGCHGQGSCPPCARKSREVQVC